MSGTAARQAVAAVDGFLRTELEARALRFALDQGWIDALLTADRNVDELLVAAGAAPRTGPLLIEILGTASVVAIEAGRVSLSAGFRLALSSRDLLEAKLWFSLLVSADVHELLGPLFTDIPQFMARAKVFELFRYDRCLEITPDNLSQARRWVEYTTALTRYEAPMALDHIDLASSGALLDIGGNSGEFARQATVRFSALHADVFDLPVVCRLGEEHIARVGDPARVRFIPGDLRNGELPGRYGAVSFKSVLHDWPDEFARSFIDKAAASLAPDGQLIVFERAQIRTGHESLPFSMVANLVFLPFFRPAAIYVGWLEQMGFTDIAVSRLELEMDFHLIVARKPA